MRPLTIVGALFIVAGVVVFVLGGVSFTKERQEAQVGPIEIATERRGVIPPLAGGAVALVGLVLFVVGGRRRG